MLKRLIVKYRDIITYIFFGVCTTAINISSYQLFYFIFGIANVPSTIIAWILAVLFAYITNKLFVFHSKSFAYKVLVREVVNFFAYRILTGLLDVAIMYISVDIMNWNALIWKVISNVLVIIINYIASNLVIFKKQEE